METGGGVEICNGPALHLYVMVQNREGYISRRGPTWRSKGPKTHTGFPSLKFQCREEEPSQHMAGKNNGDSDLGETEGCKKTQMSS